MLVSDDYRFVFHHVPKTGGTSITSVLSKYCREYEGKLPQHKPVIDCIDEPKEYFSFAFVRNPFDRVVSAWENYLQSGPFVISNNYKKAETFDEFVERDVCGGISIVSECPTQFSYLSDGSKILVDYVGRFENLTEDFYKIIGIIKVPLSILPKKNSGTLRDGYRNYYFPRSEKLVENYFEEDLSYFQYEF